VPHPVSVCESLESTGAERSITSGTVGLLEAGRLGLRRHIVAGHEPMGGVLDDRPTCSRSVWTGWAGLAGL